MNVIDIETLFDDLDYTLPYTREINCGKHLETFKKKRVTRRRSNLIKT